MAYVNLFKYFSLSLFKKLLCRNPFLNVFFKIFHDYGAVLNGIFKKFPCFGYLVILQSLAMFTH